MKKAFIVIVSVLLFCGIQAKAQNNDVTLYFSTEEMPDLLKCLPPPPDTAGTDFVNDILRYMWGKTQRNDSVRAAIAYRDSYWEYDSLIAVFTVPFGLEITKDSTPEIYRLITNSLATIDQARVKPKAFYQRKRPYERFNEHMLTEYEEEDLRGNGSYPSGHSLRGYALALLLSEVNPANADTIMARGYMYGESRVIVGAHWQSDVDASRLGNAIELSRLHTSPAFLEQLGKAQDEFKRLTGIKSETCH